MIEGLQEKLNNLSTQPGVYLFRDKSGHILYIGKAKSLRPRVRSYFQNSQALSPKTAVLMNKVWDVETILVDTEIEALMLEATLIKKHKPKYNINLRDDKSYPYIRITNELLPRIFVTRRIIKDGSRYLGPFTDVRHLRHIMRTARKIFPIRSCRYPFTEEMIAKKKVKVCLDYHIKRCQGPCEGLISSQTYNDMIRQVEKFLRGKTRELVSELEQKMQQESKNLNYEEAARLRDQIQLIENFYFKAQKVVSGDFEDRDVISLAVEGEDACSVIFKVRDGKVVGRQHFYLQNVEEKEIAVILSQFMQQHYSLTDDYPNQIFLPEDPEEQQLLENWLSKSAGHIVNLIIPQIGEKKKLVELAQKNARYLLDDLLIQKEKKKEHIVYSVKMLQKHLHLENPPRRIEAFDISNFQGQDAVASMVCFFNGKPRKTEYRHFKIRSKQTPDDFAMMQEVVTRRYQRVLKEGNPLPDLVLIDGGKGQLSSARQALLELDMRDQPVIGLAKRLEEVFIPGSSEPQNIPKSSAGLKLLQQIRDESHRFAIDYHRKLRSKRTFKSPLDDIPGIGPQRKASLMKTFGSLKKIKEASVDELVKRGKIPRKVAEAVIRQLAKDRS
jgi:excinuclease ABC subunit C